MKRFSLAAVILFITQSIYSQMPPPPFLSPGESWTNLWSVSYDYQGNGSVRYIVQDPSNSTQYCSVLMAQQDSNTAAGVQSRVYYSYTDDNGFTWLSDILDVSMNLGFPDITLRAGTPVIACNNLSFNTTVFNDVLFGGFAFSEYFGLPANIICSFPKVAGVSNGNIFLISTSNVRQPYHTVYNGSSWRPWQQLGSADNSPGGYTTASNSTGRVCIFTMDYNLKNSIRIFSSSDNGLTFDNGSTIFNYFTDGSDTLYANVFGGLQAAYQGNEPHLVFAVFKYNKLHDRSNTMVFTKPRIIHWSPATGISPVAGNYNMFPLADTLTTSLMATLCQPSIGVTASGHLKCSFTGFLKGNTQIVNDGTSVNAGEIFYCTSVNGTSWTVPVNITNTPNIEEKYSSFPVVESSNSIRLVYVRDMKAGNWVQVPAWGKAPVYSIFCNFSFITEGNEKPDLPLQRNYHNSY